MKAQFYLLLHSQRLIVKLVILIEFEYKVSLKNTKIINRSRYLNYKNFQNRYTAVQRKKAECKFQLIDFTISLENSQHFFPLEKYFLKTVKTNFQDRNFRNYFTVF